VSLLDLNPRWDEAVQAPGRGATDLCLKVPCDEGCYPKMERIRGEEVAKAFAEDQSIARHRKKGLDLASLPRLMDDVLGNINSSVSEA